VVQFVLPAITHPGHSVLGALSATSYLELALRIVSSESVACALDPISQDVSCTLFLGLSTDISPQHWLAHGTSVLQCLHVEFSENQDLTKPHSLVPFKTFISASRLNYFHAAHEIELSLVKTCSYLSDSGGLCYACGPVAG